MPKLLRHKSTYLISGLVLLTAANGVFLTLGVMRYHKYRLTPARIIFDTKVVEQKIPIKNAKLVEVANDKKAKSLAKVITSLNH